jgi:hypothetical protein
MTIEKLKKDLATAAAAAKRAADVVTDSGTCNLDGVVVPVGRRHPLARFSKKLDDVFGGGHKRIDTRWHHGYILNYAHGQADKRTVAAEAAKVALKDWGAYVFYQTD